MHHSPGRATIPRPARSRRRRAPLVRLTGFLIAAAIVSGCGAGATPVPSFDPSSRCDADVRLPGAYPDLEALVPGRLDDRPPDRLDSGRNCSQANLATLWNRGFGELEFAGGLWERDGRSGTTLAVFRSGGLTTDLIIEWYEAAAGQTTDAETPTRTRSTIGGQPSVRLDSLVAETTFQTIVAWAWSRNDGVVQVALVGSNVRDQTREQHEAAVEAAIEAFGPSGG